MTSMSPIGRAGHCHSYLLIPINSYITLHHPYYITACYITSVFIFVNSDMCVTRYETRSDYRRQEEQRDRDRHRADNLEKSESGRQRQRDRETRPEKREARGDISELRRGDRRESSKKARDRDKRFGTEGYKARRRSSTRYNTPLLSPDCCDK